MNATHAVQGQPIHRVSRKFVSDQSLKEIFQSLFQNQVDNMVDAIYHATQANTVTSHTLHTEGAESI